MIEEAYVSFEVAKLLKERGFDEPTIGLYDKDGIFINLAQFIGNANFKFYNEDKIIFAPTQQMAMVWLREKGIFIEISVSVDLNGDYHYSYSILNKECEYIRKGYTSFEWNYEDAVEVALKYCLKNLI